MMEWLLDALGALMGKGGCRDMVACRWHFSQTHLDQVLIFWSDMCFTFSTYLGQGDYFRTSCLAHRCERGFLLDLQLFALRFWPMY